MYKNTKLSKTVLFRDEYIHGKIIKKSMITMKVKIVVAPRRKGEACEWGEA